MSNRLMAGFAGAIAVVVLLGLQAVEHWAIVDEVLSGLRNNGPIGAFLVGFLTSPVVPLVIALASIYLVIEGRKERAGDHGEQHRAEDEVTAARADAKISDSGNSTATATGGKVEQHFYPATPFSPAREEEAREEENIPELERLDIRSATIIRTNERRNKWIETATGYSAIIIEFRNKHAEKGKQGAIAKSVVARLVFTPKHAKRIINNAACWLDEIVQGATIAPSEARKLVITVDMKQEGRLFTLFNPRKTLPIYYSQFAAGKEQVRSIEPNELSGVPCDVELTLISENRTLHNEKYELTAHGGIMQLVPK